MANQAQVVFTGNHLERILMTMFFDFIFLVNPQGDFFPK